MVRRQYDDISVIVVPLTHMIAKLIFYMLFNAPFQTEVMMGRARRRNRRAGRRSCLPLSCCLFGDASWGRIGRRILDGRSVVRAGLPRTGFAGGTIWWRILEGRSTIWTDLALTGFARRTTRRSYGTGCRSLLPRTFQGAVTPNLILSLRVYAIGR